MKMISEGCLQKMKFGEIQQITCGIDNRAELSHLKDTLLLATQQSNSTEIHTNVSKNTLSSSSEFLSGPHIIYSHIIGPCIIYSLTKMHIQVLFLSEVLHMFSIVCNLFK